MKIHHLQFLIISSFIILIAAGCAVSKPAICKKDQSLYCVSNGNFTDQWYDYYERALSCMEGECYDAALADLDQAVSLRGNDMRMARTFGMHFVDYFPHREKGLIHYLMGDDKNAVIEFEASIASDPSEKARFYLDRARKRIMESRTGRSSSKPSIMVNFPQNMSKTPDIRIKDDPVIISGVVTDEIELVSEVTIYRKPVFIEATGPTIKFSEALYLEQGTHRINIMARNLMGGETRQEHLIHIDRVGPVVSVESYQPGRSVSGHISDESGKIDLFINDRFVETLKKKKTRFSAKLDPDTDSVSIKAVDMLGNETIMFIDDKPAIDNLTLTMIASRKSEVSQDSSYDGYGTARMGKVTSDLPVISIRGFADTLTVFKENFSVPIEIKSRNLVASVHVNGSEILRSAGKIVSINHFIRLKPGENNILITVEDQVGNETSKQISIIRKIPEAFKLKHRYGLVFHLFDNTGEDRVKAIFSHHFLDGMIKKNRFRIRIRKQLKDFLTLHKQSLEWKPIEYPMSDYKSGFVPVSGVVLGMIHETGQGVEIAARLVDIESRQTLLTADVYKDSFDDSTLARLAARLNEKFHRMLPVSTGKVIQISENRLIAILRYPGSTKEAVQAAWPVIVFRDILKNQVDGSDTRIICDGIMDTMKKNGQVSVKVEKKHVKNISATDRIVNR